MRRSLSAGTSWSEPSVRLAMQPDCRLKTVASGTTRAHRGREDCSFSVRWQFGAGATLERVAERRFLVTRRGVSIEVDVGQEWSEVHAVAEKDIRLPVSAAAGELEATFAGTVSSAFRKLEWAPLLKLVAHPKPGRTGMFRTTFLATTRS